MSLLEMPPCDIITPERMKKGTAFMVKLDMLVNSACELENATAGKSYTVSMATIEGIARLIAIGTPRKSRIRNPINRINPT